MTGELGVAAGKTRKGSVDYVDLGPLDVVSFPLVSPPVRNITSGDPNGELILMFVIGGDQPEGRVHRSSDGRIGGRWGLVAHLIRREQRARNSALRVGRTQPLAVARRRSIRGGHRDLPREIVRTDVQRALRWWWGRSRLSSSCSSAAGFCCRPTTTSISCCGFRSSGALRFRAAAQRGVASRTGGRPLVIRDLCSHSRQLGAPGGELGVAAAVRHRSSSWRGASAARATCCFSRSPPRPARRTHLLTNWGASFRMVGASAAVSGFMAAAIYRFAFQPGGPLDSWRHHDPESYLIPARRCGGIAQFTV